MKFKEEITHDFVRATGKIQAGEHQDRASFFEDPLDREPVDRFVSCTRYFRGLVFDAPGFFGSRRLVFDFRFFGHGGRCRCARDEHGFEIRRVPGYDHGSLYRRAHYFFGSFLTTYAKSAAKEKEIIREGKELKGGLLERAERLFILFIGIVLAAFNPLWLVYVLALLAVLTNFSALQRIFIARRIAKQK